ncbi:MAG: diguanylate cyclase, partial [Variibacter sp.]|nr:diguanylate cyclase [Variibacter sp.]
MGRTQSEAKDSRLGAVTWRGTAAWIAVITAIAFVSTGVAVYSAARNADGVARQHAQQLLRHALTDHQDKMLASLAHIVEQSASPLHPALLLQSLGGRTGDRLDFVLVAVADERNLELLPLAGAEYLLGDRRQALAELSPLLAEAAAQRRLAQGADEVTPLPISRTLTLSGRPALVAATQVPQTIAGAADRTLIVATFIVETFLRQIGRRLELPDLRLVSAGQRADDMLRVDLRNTEKKVIGTLAWSAQLPSAQILSNILPFVGVAFGCVLFVSGLILGYMRHTRAAIEAGEHQLRHLAMHDPLSGLPNRTVFAQRLEAAISAARHGEAAAAVLSIDLDHFKDVNDTLGHSVGDALISSVASRLSRVLRDGDLVARLGGDEFAVIASDHVEHSSFEVLAQRIIEHLSSPYQLSGHTILIGASVGVVVIDAQTQDAADVMRFADIALHRAKSEGRNRACVYDNAMDADLAHRKQLEADLRFAIENDGLKLSYQPLVTPDGERMIGVEALCRWPHPVQGFISPTEFIPVAERSGMIIALGEWVLRQACFDGRQWPGLMVAVNVSPLQFRRPDFVDLVQRILRETGFDPNRLEIELTESTLLGNVEGAGAAMA